MSHGLCQCLPQGRISEDHILSTPSFSKFRGHLEFLKAMDRWKINSDLQVKVESQRTRENFHLLARQDK